MTESQSPLTMLFSRHTKAARFHRAFSGSAAAGVARSRRAARSSRRCPVVGFLRSTPATGFAYTLAPLMP